MALDRRERSAERPSLLPSRAARGFVGPMFAKQSADKLWDAWAFAAFHTQVALDDWYAAPSGRKGEAFARYRAALDGEERAATALAMRLAPAVPDTRAA
jgi:hypothetical protein